MIGHADASDVSTAELKVGGFAVSDEELRGFPEDDDYCNNIYIYHNIAPCFCCVIYKYSTFCRSISCCMRESQFEFR